MGDKNNTTLTARRHRHTSCPDCARSVSVPAIAARDAARWCWDCLGYDKTTARAEAVRLASLTAETF